MMNDIKIELVARLTVLPIDYHEDSYRERSPMEIEGLTFLMRERERVIHLELRKICFYRRIFQFGM